MSTVTVAIPVRDGGARLREVLAAVRAQHTERDVELLVCDSGSTDGSAAAARATGAQVIEIAPGDFQHGATRNLLMERAQGELVAFLTQDAVPAGDRWLEELAGGFELAEDVALCFGPYRPLPEATLSTARELTAWFDSFTPNGSPRIDRLAAHERDLPARELLGPRAFFTDANGAVRREAWRQVPFRAVPYAEDQQLGLDMLRAGYAKAYVPAAAVVHSHDYAPADHFRRCFDEWRGLREVFGWVEPAHPRIVRDKVLAPARADARALREDGARGPALALATARALAHHAVRTAGAITGSRADRLPPAVRRRLSLEGRDTFHPETTPTT